MFHWIRDHHRAETRTQPFPPEKKEGSGLQITENTESPSLSSSFTWCTWNRSKHKGSGLEKGKLREEVDGLKFSFQGLTPFLYDPFSLLFSIQDLRPVCPTCHAVIHTRTPPLTIEEIQAMIADAQKK